MTDPSSAPGRSGPQPPTSGSRLHRTREGGRRPWIALALVVGGLGLLGFLVLAPASTAREGLEAGRAELERAGALLLEGRIAEAHDAFGLAEQAFADAVHAASSPVLRATGYIPLLGRSTDALQVLADAGEATAHAGVLLTGAIESLPGGIGSLAPSGGSIALDAISALRPATSQARAELEHALRRTESLATSWIVGSIASARDEALHELRRAAEAMRAADSLAIALPELLGVDGERRYFLGAQTGAELRGTGGLIGAWTIMHATEGRLELEPMRSIGALSDLPPQDAPPPPASFGEPFDRFGGPGFWRNLNMGPHAPTTGEMIESLYAAVTGERLDGVILVDAQALAEMLEATGPIEDPTIDRVLEPSTVVDYLTNGAYLEFGDQAERKRVLGAAVRSVWTRFLDGTEPEAALRALADAVAGGHLVLHSADPDIQADLERAGLTGSVNEEEGQGLFGVFTSNADGTKIDYYVHREISLDVALLPDGAGSIESSVTFANTAPADADPGYVFGPFPGTGLGVADARSFVVTYCGPDCELASVILDGESSGLEAHIDRSIPIFTTFVTTEAGTTTVLEATYQQRHAWSGDPLGGIYRLVLRGQATVEPTRATVTIRTPAGMRVVDTNVPMAVDAVEATWSGTLGREQELEIRFERPFPARLWVQLWGFLTHRVEL